MVPKLSIAEYTFIFQAIDPVALPAFADPLWRSVFGLALKKLSCMADNEKCEACIHRHDCDYSFLISSPNPPGDKIGVTKHMRTIPNPHIFRSEVKEYSQKIPPGASFSATLILVGRANERLPAIIRAMAHVGMYGLGKKRSTFRLIEVMQTGPNPLDRLIMTNQAIIADGIAGSPSIPPAPERIRFTFLTPYLLPSNTKIEEGLNLTKFLMQIIRRISSLHEPYTGIALEADYKRLRTLAENPSVVESDITVDLAYRYFKDKSKCLAVRGSLLLELEHQDDLWPWIYLGQWLNVGKQASKGFGHYTLTSIDK